MQNILEKTLMPNAEQKLITAWAFSTDVEIP